MVSKDKNLTAALAVVPCSPDKLQAFLGELFYTYYDKGGAPGINSARALILHDLGNQHQRVFGRRRTGARRELCPCFGEFKGILEKLV